MENRELLPCPFCGAKPVGNYACLRCSTYDCTLGDMDIAMTKEQWNTRHPSGGLVDLDEGEVRKFIKHQEGCGEYYIDVSDDIIDNSLTKFITNLVAHFGQPNIKLPPKRQCKIHINYYDPLSGIGHIGCNDCVSNSLYNQALDDISKLNSTEG